MASVIEIPDDVWFVIISHLETARDLRGLALACRKLHAIVQAEGWRTFTRSRFSSLDVSTATRQLCGGSWKHAAESLTRQSKQWDRRSLRFTLLRPPDEGPPRESIPAGTYRPLRPYQTVVAAAYTDNGAAEVAAFGLGERLVARHRQRSTAGSQTEQIAWHRLDDGASRYTPGQDDIRALAFIGHPARPDSLAVLAGRDSGHLTLHSCDKEGFGKELCVFKPAPVKTTSRHTSPSSQPQQNTINSLDVASRSARHSYVAATTNDGVFLYRPADGDEGGQVLAPIAYHNLKRHAFESSAIQLRAAKWVGTDDTLLAIAVKGQTKHALRYLSLTPSGWVADLTSKSGAVAAAFEQHMCVGDGNICPNALEPVRLRGSASTRSTPLLLSSWRDGTCRLQDVRTPSAFDQVYQDYVDPWAEMEALLAYGTERFVGGGLHGATLKVFDLRITNKPYSYTDALPCSSRAPFPEPTYRDDSGGQVRWPPSEPTNSIPVTPADDKENTSGAAAAAHWPYRCSAAGPAYRRCRWHALARTLTYRSNASFFLAKSLPRLQRTAGVWSLAHAADFAPVFYAGIAGGVVEARLQPDGGGGASSPHGHAAVAAAAAMEEGGKPLAPALMETGDGEPYPASQGSSVRLPRLRGGGSSSWPYGGGAWVWRRGGSAAGKGGEMALRREITVQERSRHRLDYQFQLDEDFEDI